MEAGSSREAGSGGCDGMTEYLNHNSTEKVNGAEGDVTASTDASHYAGQPPSHVKTGPPTPESMQWLHLDGTGGWAGYEYWPHHYQGLFLNALANIKC